MRDTTILDLADLAPSEVGAGRLKLSRSAIVSVVAVLAVAVTSFGTVQIERAIRAAWLSPVSGKAAVRLPLDELRQVAVMTVDNKSQIIVEGLAAQQKNALIPLSKLPVEHARGFLLSNAGAESYRTALKCLTQAVYYEAAVEPLDGRRAVAQVVLNRLRHPAYPKSVCGVVYQGSDRVTGCQFSFTCDGALLRAPALRPWREAEAVAREALAGHVEADVGTATHYHADYVLPRWAFELGKITQLGRHIFYRFRGAWGRSATFSGRYSGIEHIPAINLLALRQRAAGEGYAELAGDYANGLTVPPHVTDRHAAADVGGRLDVTKEWRLSIPDPVQASSNYRQALETSSKPAGVHLTAAAE